MNKFEKSVFQRSSGHGVSSYARLLEDGRVEYVSASHTKEDRTIRYFNSKADFYNQKTKKKDE
tara:strand:- start:1671 stop:1859 length:189 start_codon:yes stop_codon:yes gene_type:complete